MATIQSPGIGSGLDINALVEKLVAAERAPLEAQLTRRESKATLQISALGSLKGALSAFKTAVDPLKSLGAINPRKASSSDEDVMTATAVSRAATGNYSIQVIDLAQAHQLASDPFIGGASSVVGTGTLTITQGGKSFDVVIDAETNTLADIRSAINSASGNSGVQATIINEVNGSRLVLTGAKTGAAQGIEVTRSGGDGGLDQLVYDPGTLENLNEMQEAQDAHIKIATFDHYSASNSISGAIDGVTLNVKAKTAANSPITIQVTDDTTLLTDRVKAFVEGYNALNTTVSQLRSYDATTKAAGPLLGDSMLLGLEDRLRSDLVNPVNSLSGSAYTTLASIGISKQLDGSLKLDESKLTAALAADNTSVAKIFGSEDGVATRLYTAIEERVRSNAGLETRNKALQREITEIQDDKDALDARMLVIEGRYRKQFTAMDTLLATLNTTSTYLAQQLENLPTPGKKT